MMSESTDHDVPPPRPPIWPWIALAAVVGAAAVWRLTGGGFAPRYFDGANHPAVGKRLEKLDLVPLTGDGPPLALDNLSGKVTLIDIWGTWCGPCLIEFPELHELVQHFQQQADFQFISVSCSNDGDDTDLAANTALFLKQARANFPTYGDPRRVTRLEVMRVAGHEIGYPTTVVLGRDGTIRGLWMGLRAGTTREMREVVEKALAPAK